MFARINCGKSIISALNYNEHKLGLGQADCIQAFNFMKDVEKLKFDEKVWHFERLTSLNERTKVNTVHISLNFHPSERLANQKLVDIGEQYMQKIGFANQPCLLYRHYDAAHPHIHLVSTNIQENGMRISLSYIGGYRSEKARKEIESAFGLVHGEGRRQDWKLRLKGTDASKLHYGKSETLEGLTHVLETVLHQYNFTSLAELNAVLKLYNVMADRGSVASWLYHCRGLYYRILDEKGNGIGVPVKASAIHFKPTLDYLENKFAENLSLRFRYLQRLKVKIDWCLLRNYPTMTDLRNALEKEGVNLVFSQNKEGLTVGVMFIDHETKTVANEMDLGLTCNVPSILEECIEKNILQQRQTEGMKQKWRPPEKNRDEENSRRKEVSRLSAEWSSPFQIHTSLARLKPTQHEGDKQSGANYQ